MSRSFVLCAALASALTAATPVDAQAPNATLQDVAFLAGHWVGGEGGDLSEEVWTEPRGDSMLGMWRYVAGGTARVLELLALQADARGVVLRLRHFSPTLAAREERDAPLVLRLVHRAPGEARFEGPAVDGPGTVVLHYRRQEPGGLEVALERGGRTERFTFRRQGASR